MPGRACPVTTLKSLIPARQLSACALRLYAALQKPNCTKLFCNRDEWHMCAGCIRRPPPPHHRPWPDIWIQCKRRAALVSHDLFPAMPAEATTTQRRGLSGPSTMGACDIRCGLSRTRRLILFGSIWVGDQGCWRTSLSGRRTSHRCW